MSLRPLLDFIAHADPRISAVANRGCWCHRGGGAAYRTPTAADALRVFRRMGGMIPCQVYPEVVLDIEAGGPQMRSGGFPFRGLV